MTSDEILDNNYHIVSCESKCIIYYRESFVMECVLFYGCDCNGEHDCVKDQDYDDFDELCNEWENCEWRNSNALFHKAVSDKRKD